MLLRSLVFKCEHAPRPLQLANALHKLLKLVDSHEKIVQISLAKYRFSCLEVKIDFLWVGISVLVLI